MAQMTEVIATDAGKRFRFETSVAPTGAPEELPPTCGGFIDRSSETAESG